MEDLLSYTNLNRRRINDIVTEVNKLEKEFSSYSDAQLSAMTDKFRKELRNGKTIDDIMPRALAACKEAIKRRLGITPYDTQIMAAAAMNNNIIAEMKTGEGKTLVQILAAYLHSLESTKYENIARWGSVHILTANEYLASRDKIQNEKVFNLLGLTCGFAEDKSMENTPGYRERKKRAYRCDIVYATAKTVAFDYLDDNQVKEPEARYITRRMDHAIIDEADDILFDQATTPLVLSGTMPGLDVKEISRLARWAVNFINGTAGARSKPLTCKVCDQYSKDASTPYYEDCIVFRDRMMVVLSDRLYDEIYAGVDLKNPRHQEMMFDIEKAVMNAIAAKYLFDRNKQYTLIEVGRKDGKRIYEVALISDTSGRVMAQTKYKNGYQEAIEAKEEHIAGDKYYIHHEIPNVDRSMITYPAFVGLYKTGVSGMTGTSDIEEFKEIYHMETYKVPPRKTERRKNHEFDLYPTKDEKYAAIVADVIEHHKKMQPILIGTISVVESDEICAYLDRAGIKYQRLDAVYDKNEADKISRAGQKGMVTVAAKMAGRGTDISISKEVDDLGGLYIIGVSKNKSERIDRQLMGRCSRQGQNGETKFYQSLEDEMILTRYGKYKLTAIKSYYLSLGGKIKNKSIRRLVDNCQKTEEGISKQQRRLEEEIEERVFRPHREKFYAERKTLLLAEPQGVMNIICDIFNSYADYIVNNPKESYKLKHLIPNINDYYNSDANTYKKNITRVLKEKLFKSKGSMVPEDYLITIKSKMLDILDTYWISHLMNLEEMRNTIIHSGYGGEDVLKRFEKDANDMFASMTPYIQNEIITYATSPNMPFGSYVVKEYNEEEKDHEISY